MIDTLDMILAISVILCALGGCYLGGYLASRGWHKAKRESLRQMMTDVVDDGKVTQ